MADEPEPTIHKGEYGLTPRQWDTVRAHEEAHANGLELTWARFAVSENGKDIIVIPEAPNSTITQIPGLEVLIENEGCRQTLKATPFVDEHGKRQVTWQYGERKPLTGGTVFRAHAVHVSAP